MLLGNGVGLKDIGFQLLFGAAGVEDEEGQQEHTLVLGLEFFQQRLGIIAVGGEVRRNDVHVITGANCLFLLLNLAAIQLRDGVLDLLDGLVLIDGLDVHGHDLAGIHVQKVLQQLVADIRSGNLQIAHGTVELSHAEDPAAGEGKRGRRDVVLYRQASLWKPLPVKPELLLITHVEHAVHQLESFLAVQQLGSNAQPVEVVHQVNFNVVEAGLRLLHGICFNSEGQVLRLGQTVVALLKLLPEHHAVFGADIIKTVVLIRNADALFKSIRIGGHIHKGQLEMDAGIEEVQEGAPFLKNGGLVLLLGQLVVDILELDCLGVVPICDTADTVREHPLKGNGLLGRPGNAVIPLGFLHRSFQFLLLLPRQLFRGNRSRRSCLCFSGFLFINGQFAVPPAQVRPDESGLHSSCSFGRGAPGDG